MPIDLRPRNATHEIISLLKRPKLQNDNKLLEIKISLQIQMSSIPFGF